MADVYHALGLHMHQPLGNLIALHNSSERWEARQILWCYDRVTRMLEGYEDVARLHMSFSGTLLKKLEDPGVRQTFGDVVDIEDFLNRYRRSNIEFVGSGLYHPVYPLCPPGEWDAQTEWWIGLGRHLLGRETFQGFWPPEMGFCRQRRKWRCIGEPGTRSIIGVGISRNGPAHCCKRKAGTKCAGR